MNGNRVAFILVLLSCICIAIAGFVSALTTRQFDETVAIADGGTVIGIIDPIMETVAPKATFEKSVATATPKSPSVKTPKPVVTVKPTPTESVKPIATPERAEIDPDRPMVALTFDDGPNNTSTMAILDVLEEYDVRATFFVLGLMAERYPQSIVRAYSLGCQIGNHTYDHIIEFKTSTVAEFESALKPVDDLLLDLIGVRADGVRPPRGSVDKENGSVEELGRPIVLWSVDPYDWKTRDTASTVASVKKDVKDGSIVLMHDIYDPTAAAVVELVPWLLEQGYQLVTVRELVESRGLSFDIGQVWRYCYRGN